MKEALYHGKDAPWRRESLGTPPAAPWRLTPRKKTFTKFNCSVVYEEKAPGWAHTEYANRVVRAWCQRRSVGKLIVAALVTHAPLLALILPLFVFLVCFWVFSSLETRRSGSNKQLLVAFAVFPFQPPSHFRSPPAFPFWDVCFLTSALY
jgi:hypothetical protein